MKQIPLAAARRETTGKGAARQMRVAGKIPAVVYSAGKPAENLMVEAREVERLLRQSGGGSAFLSLSVADEPARLAMLQEMQFDYLGKKVIHIDFHQIKADEEISVEAPIELVGEAKGAAEGGLINQNLYSVLLRGRIADIPDAVVVDISGLDLGDNIHSTDLTLPQNVAMVSEESVLVVACVAPNTGGDSGAEEEGGEAEEE